jgi:hypothetical protein
LTGYKYTSRRKPLLLPFGYVAIADRLRCGLYFSVSPATGGKRAGL